MAKKIEDRFKKLDDISHVIVRPSMYIGSIKQHDTTKYLYSDKRMSISNISYNPGFLKIFDEIITNSVDEHYRPDSKLNIIKVDIIGDTISVWDNGGIPVVKHKEHKEWIPEMVFSNLKSGSNFNDDESRIVAGTNGVGSSLTNIYSKEFKISTCDGKNIFKQTFSNNMRTRTKPEILKSNKPHTHIVYTPDYEKFELEGMDSNHILMIRRRVMDIAACNPKIKVYFSNELINFKSFEDYIKLYTEDYHCESNKDESWSIGISPSYDGYQQISFVNSIDTYDGGTHIEYIVNQIIFEIRDFFKKKHKVDIKPSEIKSHIFLFLKSTIVNPNFGSQTKEKLITESKDFGYTYKISEKLIKWVLKSEIVNSILDWIEQKKNADENKLARELNKNIGKVKVEKLIDAKGRDRWKCSLALFEGDSASSSFRKYRDAQIQGAFALRGKFVNATELTNQKLVLNDEVVKLMGSIGLKLGQKVIPGTLRYGRILIYTDADFDGSSIAALLINFLYKYWPEMFENNMIYHVETPIVVVKNIKTKKKTSFYTQQEYTEWLDKITPKDWEIKYKKGLAALVDDEYKEIINNPRLTLIKKDDQSSKYLNIWFGKESDLRKIEMLN